MLKRTQLRIGPFTMSWYFFNIENSFFLDLDLESLPRPWSAAGYLRPQSEAAPGDCPPLPSEHNIVHLGDEATADGACARI